MLGFKYNTTKNVEIYNDGHQRSDVKVYTDLYVKNMLQVSLSRCNHYHGDDLLLCENYTTINQPLDVVDHTREIEAIEIELNANESLNIIQRQTIVNSLKTI